MTNEQAISRWLKPSYTHEIVYYAIFIASGHGCKSIKVNLRSMIYIMLVEASQLAINNN